MIRIFNREVLLINSPNLFKTRFWKYSWEFYWFRKVVPNFKCPECGSKIVLDLSEKSSIDYACFNCSHMGSLNNIWSVNLSKKLENYFSDEFYTLKDKLEKEQRKNE
jgi:DNA-directed RNA polymerase subunit RPC12/RpoP